MSLDQWLKILLDKMFGNMDNIDKAVIMFLLFLGFMTISLPVIITFLWILGII